MLVGQQGKCPCIYIGNKKTPVKNFVYKVSMNEPNEIKYTWALNGIISLVLDITLKFKGTKNQ